MLPYYSTLTRVISASLIFFSASCFSSEDTQQDASIEEVHIWGESLQRNAAGYTNPTSVLTQDDMESINVATTEDLVKFEPSLVIRRRFIGDSNGTLGMRGSNMFQTSRSMVFADGVPLHYLLQSRWNGAPRWTMVSASEIAQIEVVYGPFSAEHSGNAMGGVVNIETAIPQEQEARADVSLFSQAFNAYGFDDTVAGYKGFFSYGNKIDDLSVYLSYNHLDNEGQPQTFRYGSSSAATNPIPVNGLVENYDPRLDRDGNKQQHWYFGDTGIVDTNTDNIKLKIGYDFGRWASLVNVAYEDRSSINSPNSYVKDTNGNTVWSGDVEQNGIALSIPSNRLNVSHRQRNSLSMGLRLRGELNENASLEANINQFSILNDENASSSSNPNAVNHTLSGQVSDFDNTGWKTAKLKLTLNDVGVTGLTLINGIQHEAYTLHYVVHNSDNYQSAQQTSLSNRNGGETDITALFTQVNWALNNTWDISFGGRFESFNSKNGYYTDDDSATSELDLVDTPETSGEKFSPKFSLGFSESDNWSLRYSLAKAYRFPIVEELFSQYSAYNAISEANPELKPEDGIHHNVMYDYNLDGGYLRINVFSETVNNAIESQSETISSGPNTGVSVRTFVPIDEVKTTGIEFIINKEGFVLPNLDVRFNTTYTDSEIIRNEANPAIEGNIYPRMPKWRANFLSTLHLNDLWKLSANLQYASDSFGRTDNSDTIDNVYGAQDAYTRMGVKTSYQWDKNIKLGFGIDNITDEIAYVAHPWPGRTVYANFSYAL